MNKEKITVRIKDKLFVFTQAEDGWYDNKQNHLAIDQDKTLCRTYPWFGDAFGPPPEHAFEVVEMGVRKEKISI